MIGLGRLRVILVRVFVSGCHDLMFPILHNENTPLAKLSGRFPSRRAASGPVLSVKAADHVIILDLDL